jgi:hypothetical protein
MYGANIARTRGTRRREDTFVGNDRLPEELALFERNHVTPASANHNIAQAVAFCSRRRAYITGEVVKVDGGMRCTHAAMRRLRLVGANAPRLFGSVLRSPHTASRSAPDSGDHAVTYFAPECEQAFKDVGLRGFWMGYFAGRAAPMGPVTAPVVSATFFNFHPAMVERAIPDAWTFASPSEVLATRVGAAATTLRRVLPDIDEHAARSTRCWHGGRGRIVRRPASRRGQPGARRRRRSRSRAVAARHDAARAPR